MTERHQLTLDSLRVFPKAELTMVLECAGNGRTLMKPTPGGTPWTLGGASTTTFTGVWLRDVVRSWAIPTETVDLVFTGADWGTVPGDGEISYQFSLPVDDARGGDSMLAMAMSGEPLSPEHGAPLRLVVPGHYAMKSVKWLRSIEAAASPFNGHFVRKYRYFGDDEAPDDAPVGPIRVRAMIAKPSDAQRVTAGPVEVVGAAWSAGRVISKVEVSADAGATWVEADLKPQPSSYASRPWSATIDVEEGTVTIVAKATDESGATQPLEPRWNGNGYGNNVAHRVTVVAS
jgi:DMSO/TMAO reductase YedYZ molybdopterin-dependent catalytic subunit